MTEPRHSPTRFFWALLVVLMLATVGVTFSVLNTSQDQRPIPTKAPSSVLGPQPLQSAPLPVAHVGAGSKTPLQDLAERVQAKGAVPNEAVITFANAAALAEFLKQAGNSGLVIKGRLDAQRSVRVGYGSLDMLQSALAAQGSNVANVGAIFPVFSPGLPSAPPQSAGGNGTAPFGDALMSAIGAGPDVDRSQWGSGVTVAVLDSGVGSHPTFTEGQVTHIDLVNDGQPFDGHGTLVASLIAGNMQGAQGVSPDTQILDVRIAGASGTSDSFQLASGIEAALDRGVQVINISMGSYGDSPIVAQAVDDALQRGVIVVAAAGNEQQAAKDWPAAYPGVISVSGVDATGHLAYFSNSGDPTLAAPAVGVPSAYEQNNQPYLATGDGTSQAAALVSGAAAAILGRGGDVLNTLSKSAAAIPATSQQAGAGMLHLPTGK